MEQNLKGNNTKNKRMTVVVAALLLVIGISFAYFTARLLINGNGASTKVNTARINGAVLNVEGTLSFDDSNILPGHKNIASIKVTATGDNEIVGYNLIWNGTNTLSTLNFTVYKTSTLVNASMSCNTVNGTYNGMKTVSEECSITNGDSLGSVFASGTISKSDVETKVVLAKDEVITATKSGNVVYYYVVLEYPNLNEPQNSEIGGLFDGEVTIEESEASADINITGIYQEQDDKTFLKVSNIPSSSAGFVLDEVQSTCTNNAKPTWDKDSWSLVVDNLETSGTNCSLYFKKKVNASDTILGSTTVKAGTNSFTGPATTEADSGLFSINDDDGTTYYYRGVLSDSTVNNWVDFAGFKWRIIRTNGDGSIRMIYNGTDYSQTGEGTQLQTSAFNSTANDNAYVGYMYGSTGQSTYAATHTNTNSSTIKGVLDNWYKTNIVDKNYDKYVSKEAGFCGDRQVLTGVIGDFTGNGVGTANSTYAPYTRLFSESAWKTTQTPTYSCNTNDFYTVNTSSKGNKALQYPIGLISADEVIYGGGFGGAQNQQYWLYTNQYYWTISPLFYNATTAYMFYVLNTGYLGDQFYGHVSNSRGVRPVINLASDVQLTGSGTTSDPFKIVA